MEDILVKASKDATHIGVHVQLSDTSQCSPPDPDLRKLKRRAKRNGYGILKQVLVDELERYIGLESIRVLLKGGEPLLSITMECGNSMDYRTFDDIPEGDVPCPCGNSKHWMIQYKDLR